MTDYKEGVWYGWNGGECPVHPESIVQVRLADRSCEDGDMTERAGNWVWLAENNADIIVFRVIKQHREPQEVYFRMDESWGWRECHSKDTGATLFREVLE